MEQTQMTALAATVRKLTTMVDGTVRVTMDFDASREVMEMCATPGTTVAVAMLTAEAARESLVSDSMTNATQSVTPSVTYGDEAQKLKLSGFCDRIEVQNALGLTITDRGKDPEYAHVVSQGCWDRLKSVLGYASMRDVPPKVLHDWAFEHGLVGFLPACFQDA